MSKYGKISIDKPCGHCYNLIKCNDREQVDAPYAQRELSFGARQRLKNIEYILRAVHQKETSRLQRVFPSQDFRYNDTF